MDALLERMRLMETGMTHAGAASQAAEARATAAEAQLQHAIGQMQQMGQRQANGAGPPRPPPTSLVDTRTLGKPKSFDGREAHWRGYRFGISAYAAAVDPHLGALMTSAATVQESDTLMATLNLENQRLATQLYYMLALSIDGDTSALTIVERAGPGEGLLAWWRLLQAFEPDTAGRAAALLQEILSFTFESEDIRGSFDTFDLLIKRYETAASDVLPDKLKVGMVSRGIRDTDIKQHLLMQSGRLDTYSLVREEIRSITIARRAMMPSSEHTSMDVGWVGAEGQERQGQEGWQGQGRQG